MSHLRRASWSVVVLMALWAVPAHAIRNGDPDIGSAYGAVGEVLFGDGHPACSGTMLSPSLVLTAAHCLMGLAPDAVIEFSPGPGRSAPVTAVRVHPQFEGEGSPNLTFDVALLRLDRAAVSGWDDIVPMTLRDGDLEPGFFGVEATAVGFGETSTGAGSGTRRSGAVTVTQLIPGEGPIGVVQPHAFIEVVPGDERDQMLCPGDEGGPLVSGGQLAGVASFRFVVTCDEPGPGYYLGLGHVADWIRTTSLDLDLEPPTANAGPDQSIHGRQDVPLDGRASFDDNTSTDELRFAWTLVSKPPSSDADLGGDDTATPVLSADVSGDYVISLTVTDSSGLASAPDVVVVSSRNAAPLAKAGLDQAAVVGQLVELDASGSTDADGDPLRFTWTLEPPAGSLAALVGEETSRPTFVPDLPGTYSATVSVSDAFAVRTDSVIISVVTAEDFVEGQTAAALNDVSELPRSSLTTVGNQQALQTFLTQTLTALQAGDRRQATKKLTQAIERTDGCGARGAPDGQGPGRDWVTDCAAQTLLHAKLETALGALRP